MRTIERSDPVLEVPIKGNYAPNVFVSAFVVRGRIGGVAPTALIDLGKPAYKMGLAELRVGWSAHELLVKVTPTQAAYKVRDKARVTIAVRRTDGSAPPAGSEVALAAVDEGLGALFFGIPPDYIPEFRRLYGVPEQYVPIGAVTIGHPDAAADLGGSSKVIKRRSLDDLVHKGHW